MTKRALQSQVTYLTDEVKKSLPQSQAKGILLILLTSVRHWLDECPAYATDRSAESKTVNENKEKE